MAEGKRQQTGGSGGGGHLGFDLVRVALGQLLLTGGGNQDVAVSLQDVSLIRCRIRETHNGPVSLQVQTPHYCSVLTY